MTRFIKKALIAIFITLVLLYLFVPALMVFPLALSTSPFLQFPPPGFSFGWYSQFFADSTWTSALIRSLEVGSSVAVIATIIGGVTAYYVARRKNVAARILEPITIVPLAVPIIVFGLGLYTIALSLGLVGSLWLLALAHSALALPYSYINFRVGYSTINPRLEMAAQSLGAKPANAFSRVVLPLLVPTILASLILSFITSIDETVVALFITGSNAPTLPVEMFTSINYNLNPLVPVAGTIILLLTIIGVLATLILRWITRSLLGVRGKESIDGVGTIEAAAANSDSYDRDSYDRRGAGHSARVP